MQALNSLHKEIKRVLSGKDISSSDSPGIQATSSQKLACTEDNMIPLGCLQLIILMYFAM